MNSVIKFAQQKNVFGHHAINDERCDGVRLDPETFKRQTEVTEWTPAATQNLYMHVYFGKQIESSQDWNLPYLNKVSETGGVTGYAVSHGINYNRKGRMKAAPFFDMNTMMTCIERDSKLHKVYDMSKPFSFFVRPMVASNEVSKEAGANVAQEAAELITQPTNEIEQLQKGLKHLGYKEFTHSLTSKLLDIPQDAYSVKHAHDPQDKFYNRWTALSDDDNFFNPVMFWYCFTTSDRYVPNYAEYMDAKKL